MLLILSINKLIYIAVNKYVLSTQCTISLLLQYFLSKYINHYNYNVLIIFIRFSLVTFPQSLWLRSTNLFLFSLSVSLFSSLIYCGDTGKSNITSFCILWILLVLYICNYIIILYFTFLFSLFVFVSAAGQYYTVI